MTKEQRDPRTNKYHAYVTDGTTSKCGPIRDSLIEAERDRKKLMKQKPTGWLEQFRRGKWRMIVRCNDMSKEGFGGCILPEEHEGPHYHTQKE